jgi:DNA-binding transcriptional ArsR family regulator
VKVAAPSKARLDAPYRGIEPFRYEDRPIFFARGREIDEVLSYVSVYRAALLYGESGSGKSSLVNAGVTPAAEERGFAPVKIRFQPRTGEEVIVEPLANRSVEETLGAALFPEDRKQRQGVLAARRLPGVLRSVAPDRRPLLVFDQFEELVTLFEEAPRGPALEEAQEAQKAIVETLVDLIHDQTLPIKMLFVFRDDYLAKVLRLFALAPHVRDQYVHLAAPNVSELPSIIRGPFDAFPDAFGTEITKSLATDLAAAIDRRSESDLVNLSEVQIACLRLWRSADPEAEFDAKGVQGLLEDHMAEALGELGADLTYPAIALLSQMITPSGLRNVISEEDLITRTKADEGVSERTLTKALAALERAKLIRKERRHQAHFYEIVSEFLVAWIIRQRDERATRREIQRILDQVTMDEYRYHWQFLRTFRLTRIVALIVTVVAGGALLGIGLLDKLSFWTVTLVVTVLISVSAFIQLFVGQRALRYRRASQQAAVQRHELAALVGDETEGGLTSYQIAELGTRLDVLTESAEAWTT